MSPPPCPPTEREGDIVFDVDPYGIGVGMTLSCVQDKIAHERMGGLEPNLH